MLETIDNRLTTVEVALAEYIIQTNKILHRTEKDTRQLKEEMKEFKDEMKEFKDEMKEFKEFVTADIAEMREDRKKMNEQWGHLANKLGTFAEDIAAPNLPRIAKQYFNEKNIIRYLPNVEAQHPLQSDVEYEFDAVVETENKVLLLETKYTIRMQYIEKIPDIIQHFEICFPEYSNKELITIFASMKIAENIVKRLTKMGIYAMAMADDTMDLLNFEAVQKKRK